MSGTAVAASSGGFHCRPVRVVRIAQRFIDDQDAGGPEFTRLRAEGEQHPIEGTGRELRKLMAWVDSDRDQDYVEGSAAR